MNRKLIAIAALAGFATFGAQAFQGEQNPLPPQPFQSTLDRSTVQAEARMPVKISNGGTGVMASRTSTTDRATVKADATAITRAGAATYGEVTDRPM
ncbi:MAG: DUF4148 domain-containing protein [Comamonadaceae bacterium]|nr:MAG: DUF4148 domain-containing protein [Comamonadaceae bacterium]